MARESAQRKMTEFESMCHVYQELAPPGAPHKLLAGMAGTWNVKSRWWMDPGGPPMESTGNSEQKMILDGRFLQQDFSGEMMGSPFAGIGFTGYNNHTEKYVSTWMDSMGTGIYYFDRFGNLELLYRTPGIGDSPCSPDVFYDWGGSGLFPVVGVTSISRGS